MDAAVFTDPHEYKAVGYLDGSQNAGKSNYIKTKPFQVVDNDVLPWGDGLAGPGGLFQVSWPSPFGSRYWTSTSQVSSMEESLRSHLFKNWVLASVTRCESGVERRAWDIYQ
ncbi:Uu.00g140960.m01.CDS01 [Anthostomella pinea]|uniref:Uu.00g140960.m01.CDS01 n=1 Tax=Anthostomella pinea TaxID=933095 RepID=A0AAI8VJR2_9PEZI|nr:Uu.00g140960.m01.CDS01 [Anthostomella pinea]